MGYGDDIMGTAIMRNERIRRQKLLVFGDEKSQTVHWSPVFQHNPNFTPPEHVPNLPPDALGWVSAAKPRRYASQDVENRRFVWVPHEPLERGDIFLTVGEQERARGICGGALGFIALEPNSDARLSANKAWPFERWQEVADMLIAAGLAVAQIGAAGGRALERVPFYATDKFRDGCAVLARAALFVGCDGGLVHAAAALGVPAVVLWGHYISPHVVGYPWHRHLRAPGLDPYGCGSLDPCAECAAAWDWIKPSHVFEAAREAFQPLVGEMEQYLGVWLPAGETHFKTGVGQRVVNGKATYQFHTLMAALDHTPRRQHVVDVGGNVGYWSMHLQKVFARVTAYEPAGYIRQCFRRNTVPTNIDLMPFAVGKEPGSLNLVVNPESCGHTHLVPGKTEGSPVPVTTLDADLLGRGVQTVDLLKIDVEGFELQVVQGAEQMIKTLQPTICVEQKPWAYWNRDRYAAVRLLENWGYRVAQRLIDDFIMAPQ